MAYGQERSDRVTPGAPQKSALGSAISRLDQANEALGQMLGRLSSVANRVVGTVPQDVGDRGEAVSTNSALLEIESGLSVLHARLRELDATICRLEVL